MIHTPWLSHSLLNSRLVAQYLASLACRTLFVQTSYSTLLSYLFKAVVLAFLKSTFALHRFNYKYLHFSIASIDKCFSMTLSFFRFQSSFKSLLITSNVCALSRFSSIFNKLGFTYTFCSIRFSSIFYVLGLTCSICSFI